ncbi:hypothetical protein FWK35_00033983 [Aphis craccivora]|nr:hypothetical protein FWK35_00026779 [Aphis craccivora]KAF0766590.1 hypothetical protein FWK35_00033983 [Aphis craccivora]
MIVIQKLITVNT